MEYVGRRTVSSGKEKKKKERGEEENTVLQGETLNEITFVFVILRVS